MGIRYLVFAMFLFVSCFLVLGITAADSNCSSITDPGIILAKCIAYIRYFMPLPEPSNDCCTAMKIDNAVQCICQNPPPNFEIFVSMEKFVDVATTCGSQTPPPGQKCGLYTIPSTPAPPVDPSPPVQPSPAAPIRPSPPVQPSPAAPIRPSPPVPRSPRRPPPRRRSPPLP